MTFKLWLKKYILPDRALALARPLWHGFLALLGHFYYGRPSRRLVVIGVTGTNGKSTTVNLLAKILEQAGYKTGYTSTVTMKLGGPESLNRMKMTMPSGWLLHKWLRRMADNGCQYAILEVSSEGLAQNRHLGICFDAAVFTNLTPEHIESHGGFENYKQAKAALFASLKRHERTDKGRKIQKAIIVNADDEYGNYYASFQAGQHASYAVKNQNADFVATDIRYSPQGLEFKIQNLDFKIQLKGQFDVYNALAAVAAARSQGVSLQVCRLALEQVLVIPGRVEVITQNPFTVVVDYAYEPEEMRQLYETVSRWPHRKVLQVLGPTGGGRDKARIPALGEMAAVFADFVWITTDDPYDDDPRALGQQMAKGALARGKVLDKDLFCLYDRRWAIRNALLWAGPGDIVLVTGKGADQKMALANGRYEEWDDRVVVKEELESIKRLCSKGPR